MSNFLNQYFVKEMGFKSGCFGWFFLLPEKTYHQRKVIAMSGLVNQTIFLSPLCECNKSAYACALLSFFEKLNKYTFVNNCLIIKYGST